MTIFIEGDIELKKELFFYKPNSNVFILGKLKSDYDLSFEVNNLIVLGKIITKKKFIY